MVFSSVTFLFFFLPSVIIGFLVLPQKWKKWFLLFASLFFYTWGEGLAIAVLLATVVISYGAAICSKRFPRFRSWFLIGAIVLSLAILGIFKYADFFIGILRSITQIDIPYAGLSLPLGISFFTFQAVSYLIDVYRDTKNIEYKFSNFLLYISFFPQLVAGPIVRHSEIVDNLENPHTHHDNVTLGLQRFVIGLAKKVLIADAVAVIADTIFGLPASDLTFSLAWIGTIAYGIQIYFDFSGYSDMAIGMGKIFGFHFPENFKFPYTATSIQDFWRRWHMTLSRWIRDYLYIPLGGSRKGNVRTYINIIIAFTLCGLWHGAAWTFVLWGAYYGILQSLERIPVVKNFFEKIPLFFRHIYTLLIVFIGWVFFRAEGIHAALGILGAMVGRAQGTTSLFEIMQPYYMLWLIIGVIGCIPFQFVRKRITSERFQIARYVVIVLLLLLTIVKVSNQQYSPFIYFRF